jgi:ABC-type lipoprotein export system ATPase subunit/multidrug resistance efflux pump
VVAVASAAFAVSRVERAAPSVERAAVRVDEVRRGPLLRAVKGPGTLVPRHVRWLSADTAGRVERILVRPGAAVQPETVLMELANPDVNLQALEAERQLASAEAELVNLRSTLEAARLAQEAALATLRTERAEADRRAGTNERLRATGAISDLEARQADEKADELRRRVKLEEQRLGVMADGLRDRLAAQRSQVDKLRAVARFRSEQVERMRVRAGEAGLLQDLPLELGQWVTPGVVLARVARPGELKAELRVPETLAKDVAPGQRAEIDLRTATVPGQVVRVAPAAREGSVLVEVELEGTPPPGARADLQVDGTIELERVPSALFVGRPAGAQPESTVELYRVAADGATRGAGLRAPGARLPQRHRAPRGARRGRQGGPLGSERRRGRAEGEAAMTAREAISRSAGGAPVIDLRGVSKVFLTDEVETHALSNVHLAVQPGEWLSIVGPSGSGKTTLLAILGLLDTPSAGSYRLGGHDAAGLGARERAILRNEQIGFVFQSFNLIGDLTVSENVELPLTYRGMAPSERRQRVEGALEQVGMSHRARHLPSQLSGGQQQRVAVARAIAGDPAIAPAGFRSPRRRRGAGGDRAPRRRARAVHGGLRAAGAAAPPHAGRGRAGVAGAPRRRPGAPRPGGGGGRAAADGGGGRRPGGAGAHQPAAQRRRRRARHGRRGARGVGARGRRRGAARARRGSGAPRGGQPVRALLHHQAGRLGRGPHPVAPDRRGARRPPHPARRRGRRLPRRAVAAGAARGGVPSALVTAGSLAAGPSHAARATCRRSRRVMRRCPPLPMTAAR